jgi:metal-sulfur cluster biosynthetic enzyme
VTVATAAVAARPVRAAVLAALDTVRDPELDEPITRLGFVASFSCSDDGVASVRLQLPTYFCAPNFAFLMVADAFDAVSAVDGVRRADVTLQDHFAAETINRGVAARSGFAESFGDLAAGELDELRADFVRKAVLAGADRVCRPLLANGATVEELTAMTLRGAPPSDDLERLRARRAELGLPHDDAAPLLIDVPTGDRISPDAAGQHLARARLTRVNTEANTGICRGMLKERYGAAGTGAAEAQ